MATINKHPTSWCLCRRSCRGAAGWQRAAAGDAGRILDISKIMYIPTST